MKAFAFLVIVGTCAGLACNSTVEVESTPSGGGKTTGSNSSSMGASGGTGGFGASGASGGGIGLGGTGAEGGLGGTGGGGPSGGGGSGGSPSCQGFGDECTECMAASCAATYCACLEEDHCFGYLQCLGTCSMGDTTCFQSCAAVHEPGISLGILTSDCAGTTCDMSCQFGNPLNDCQKCLYTNCSSEMNACIANPECLGLVQCLQMCTPGDQACGQACVATYPEGLTDAQSVRDCRDTFCSGDCP